MGSRLEKEALPHWRPCLDLWGYGIDLSEPTALETPGELAYIDLKDRKTKVNYGWIERLGLGPEIRTIYAHEIGHHIRYPHTLVRSAKLAQKQRELLAFLMDKHLEGRDRKKASPKHFDFLLNLFLDALINDELWRERKLPLPRVYQKLLQAIPNPSAVYSFYMALYEALWKLEPGHLVTKEISSELGRAKKDWRDDASLLARDLRSEDNMFTQLSIFLYAFWPYVAADLKKRPERTTFLLTEDRFAEAPGKLSPEEILRAVEEWDEEREADAWRKRREDDRVVPGIPKSKTSEKSQRTKGWDRLNRAIQWTRAMDEPGKAPMVILRAYERLADEFLLDPDKEVRWEEATPTTLSTWEVGDDLEEADWRASLLRSGLLVPGVTTVKRDKEEEPVRESPDRPPWLEIYIDSSGSMPDPREEFSHLAFAGFLLGRTAIQAGSKVRIVQYSGAGQIKAMKEFSSSLRVVFQALLEYFGDGTQFPFAFLKESLRTYGSLQPIRRIVLSDPDFFANCLGPSTIPKPLEILGEAQSESASFTAILNLEPLLVLDIEAPPELVETGIEILGVGDWEALAGVSSRLSKILFPDLFRPA